MSTIQSISRPYVGQGAKNIDDVKQVSDKKAGDVTSPATPQLVRAWAFELAADGSTLAPPPPPPGQPGRDPLVIELAQIEIGTRIELISLSDNPAAEFCKKCEGEIFELPLTGYDVQNRRATIALNEDQMKAKGIAPGERFMLRQVDKDGNASEAIHVHLDPNGWANQNISEPVQGGGTQNVRGRQIDIAVGMHNLQGNPNPGQMERVLGKAATDASAPKLLEANIKVETTKVSKSDHEALQKYYAAITTLIGGQDWDAASIKTYLTNNPSWAQNTSYKPHYDVLQALSADATQFDKLVKLTNAIAGGTSTTHLSFAGAQKVASTSTAPSFASLTFDKALEPGVTATVQNSRTGEVVAGAVGDNARSLRLNLNDVKDGDPLIITYVDRHGNAGAPYGFRFDEAAKDGKAKSNPLDIRLGGFSLRPKPTTTPSA